MKKNRKGFTLVEILAAVTILGILSVIAIVSVNKIIQNAKEKHYTTAEDQLELAGQSYVQQNRSALPKAIGQKTKISLKTLVEKNYIDQIKDYSDNDCNLENSYVQIFKYSKDDYSYLAYLDCPVYTSEEQIKQGSPQIEITMSDPNKTKTATADIKISDNEKLLSWSYIIYKNGKEVKNSGSTLLPNYDKELTKTLKLSSYTPGSIKVVVTATNIYGMTTTKTSSLVNYKDTEGPECVIETDDNDSKTWSTGPITITVGCNDHDGVGCTREKYTKTFKTSTDIGKIIIEDKAGNKTECEVSVNIDITKPTITVKAYKRTASGGKTGSAIASVTANNSKSDVTLDLSSLSTTKWLNNRYSENGIYYEVTYTDGHSTVTYEAKENPGNLAQTATNINTMTVIDSGSETTKTKTATYATTVDGYRIYELTAKDAVNNTTHVKIITPLDRVAPNVPTLALYQWNNNDDTSPTTASGLTNRYTANTWSNKNVFTTVSGSTDTISGFKEYQYTTTGATENNENKAATYRNIKAEGTSTIKYTACDVAGNCSAYTTAATIKIDKTAPTCTVSGGSTTWINASSTTTKRTISAKCSDSGSECKTSGFSTDYSNNINTTTAGAKGDGVGGSVEDNAGNVTQCSANQTVKIDKNPPTCAVSGGSTTWINSSSSTTKRTITATCSDTGGSNCKEKSFSTDYSSNINTTTAGAKGNSSGGTVEDNAGNKTDCAANQTVKIDKTPPTITFSQEGGTYKNSDGITVTISCTDNESGTTSTGKSVTISSPTKDKEVSYACDDTAGNSTTKKETYNVKKYSRDSSCGAESYETCAHSDCGYYSCSSCGCSSYSAWSYVSDFYTEPTYSNAPSYVNTYDKCECILHSSQPSGSVGDIYYCKNYSRTCTAYKSCSSCGTKTCTTESCGVKTYNKCWHY